MATGRAADDAPSLDAAIEGSWRIEAAATGGEILLSEAFRAGAGLAPCEPRGIAAKGKTEPLEVHRLR